MSGASSIDNSPDEDLRRRQPEEYERRKREAYVRGGGNGPAVVTFTTATACMAVDELLQALTGFRGPNGWVWQRSRRFDLMQDRRPGANQDRSAQFAWKPAVWGRADVEPFLDQAG